MKLFINKYITNVFSLQIYNKFIFDLLEYKITYEYDYKIFGEFLLKIINNIINNCDIDII
jgi:hypothetical protein